MEEVILVVSVLYSTFSYLNLRDERKQFKKKLEEKEESNLKLVKETSELKEKLGLAKEEVWRLRCKLEEMEGK